MSSRSCELGSALITSFTMIDIGQKDDHQVPVVPDVLAGADRKDSSRPTSTPYGLQNYVPT